jgi:hypothetical protein
MHDRKPEEIHNDEKLESAQKNFPACGHGSGQGRTPPPKIFGSPAGPFRPACACRIPSGPLGLLPQQVGTTSRQLRDKSQA